MQVILFKRFFFILILFIGAKSFAQPNDSIPVLITNMEIQIECTEGINSMYNFDFKRADSQFRWLKRKYPWHPIPYFLLGLSQWWRMMPNIKETKHDEALIMYLDSAILVAQNIFDKGSKVEGAFFISAAHAFKGRYYAERRSWGKAASAGKSALKYLDYCRDQEGFGPEILFGDALYNYYSVWIPENYPLLKPIMLFFENGDKGLGLKQLKEVANNAFFTRTEAQYFLMRLLASEEKDPRSALYIAEYLHKTFPNNAYFHRYNARLLYSTGQYSRMELVAKSIITKIDSSYVGYEQNSGRYAAFFLGEVYSSRGNDSEAEKYYRLSVKYGDEVGAQEKGYYIYSVYYLGKYAAARGDKEQAETCFKRVKKLSDRKDRAYRLAKNQLKAL